MSTEIFTDDRRGQIQQFAFTPPFNMDDVSKPDSRDFYGSPVENPFQIQLDNDLSESAKLILKTEPNSPKARAIEHLSARVANANKYTERVVKGGVLDKQKNNDTDRKLEAVVKAQVNFKNAVEEAANQNNLEPALKLLQEELAAVKALREATGKELAPAYAGRNHIYAEALQARCDTKFVENLQATIDALKTEQEKKNRFDGLSIFSRDSILETQAALKKIAEGSLKPDEIQSLCSLAIDASRKYKSLSATDNADARELDNYLLRFGEEVIPRLTSELSNFIGNAEVEFYVQGHLSQLINAADLINPNNSEQNLKLVGTLSQVTDIIQAAKTQRGITDQRRIIFKLVQAREQNINVHYSPESTVSIINFLCDKRFNPNCVVWGDLKPREYYNTTIKWITDLLVGQSTNLTPTDINNLRSSINWLSISPEAGARFYKQLFAKIPVNGPIPNSVDLLEIFEDNKMTL